MMQFFIRTGRFPALKAAFTCILLMSAALSAWAQDTPLRIALSKATPRYIQWLKTADSTVITVDLYRLPTGDAVKELVSCNGLLLTGGEDLHPGLYGMLSDSLLCQDVNRHRDSLEIALIGKALSVKMPVFAICRGEQIMNVINGGTLITDIPEKKGTRVIHRMEDYARCFHPVAVEKNTLLASVCRCDTATVTSNHHQAAGLLSPDLRASAYATDGIIEGIEWLQPDGKSFLIAVQWHPERMSRDNPLSGPLAREFLRQANLFQTLNRNIR